MYLEESEITTKSIENIFSGAFLNIVKINDDGFSVTGPDSIISTSVFNQAERKVIHFRHTIQIQHISEQEAALICNEVNASVSMVKVNTLTYDSGEIAILSSYQMTYEKGVIRHQVMSNYRWFEKIVPHLLRTYFGNNL